MAKKLRVIGEGCEFYDDWRKGDGLICGVKISGTNVDVLDHLGNWLMIKGVGEPIDRLLWEKGGGMCMPSPPPDDYYIALIYPPTLK